jgi:hypothetical protein
MLRTLLCLLALSLLVKAGTTPEGGLCSSNNDHLDPDTLDFLSECTDQTFCSAGVNGTCIPRQCRRDEFPFGFGPETVPPPLCAPGTFCPDEGSGCQPLAAVGEPCQLNRDEQCAPPPDWQDLASPQNCNGSICLHSICLCVRCLPCMRIFLISFSYANMTLSSPCIIDNITYTDFDANGQQLQQVFTRDNCRTPNFYCDEVSMSCQLTKAIGQGCLADQECKEVCPILFAFLPSADHTWLA